jgi:hypothetical protein
MIDTVEEHKPLWLARLLVGVMTTMCITGCYYFFVVVL